MEVDEEVEADLLRQFNCLNTSDKDVLIKELQGLLGRDSDISEQSARFYLDMADWNLQAAICAYFDLQSSTRLPQMTFVQDVTIGEGESVPPNTRFVKTWRVENSGSDSWPEGCRLRHTGGDRLGAAEASEPLMCLPPLTRLDVSMQMLAPQQQGLYSSKWRMTTHQGHFFGDTIWVIIQVDDGGTLALMQQMVNLKELGSSPPQAPPPSPAHALPNMPRPQPSTNPFSPNKELGAPASGVNQSPNSIFGSDASSWKASEQPSSGGSDASSNNLADRDASSKHYYLSSSTTTTNTITSSTRTFPSTYCTTSQAELRHSFIPSPLATSSDSSATRYCNTPLPSVSCFPPLSSLSTASSAATVPPSTVSPVTVFSSSSFAPDADHDVTMS